MQICNFLRLVCALKSASLLCMHVDLKDKKCLINNPPPYCIYLVMDQDIPKLDLALWKII